MQNLWQVLVPLGILCFALSNSQAQNQPIETVWSPSYSVEAKSIKGNQSGWWIAGRAQLHDKRPYQPMLLHWQPAADSFSIKKLWSASINHDLQSNHEGHVSTLQKHANGRISASAHYKIDCSLPTLGQLNNRVFPSSDSSFTQWVFGQGLQFVRRFRESYTFPSDSALVIADSLYAVDPNGQPIVSKTLSMKRPVRHVSYRQNQVGIVSQEGIALYNQQATQLHQNMSIDSLHATHWQGDTIAATDGDTLVYYDDSLQILAQKDLSADFSSAPVLTTWQDRLLVAGLTPQGTEWHVKAITMNQQMSTLVTFGDSSWRLKDMYVQDSVLGVTGGQQKRNSSALLFKTIDLPDTAQDRSLDVALTNAYTDNVSIESIPRPNRFHVHYNLYGTVQNKSQQDTVHQLTTYFGIQEPLPQCMMPCEDNHYHHVHDSITLLPGESTTLLIGNVTDFCEKDSVQKEICPVVMAPNRAIDPDMSNNSTCDTLTVVGVETPSPSSANIRISPTYVKQQLVIEKDASFDQARVTIHDIQGRLIYQSKMSSIRATIDLNAQPTGVYVATVSTPQGTYSRKFVIGE